MTNTSIHGSQTENNTNYATQHLSEFQLAVYDGLKAVDPHAAKRYLECGRDGEGWVKYCANCADSGPGFYAEYIPRSCMLRICPDCAKRVAAPIRDRYRPIIEHLMSHPYKDWRVRGWTVTRAVELSGDSGEDVRETLEMVAELVRQLVTCHDGAGAICSLEIGETGHKIHCHLIVYSPYVTHQAVKTAWRAISGDSYIVWLRLYETPDAAVVEGLKYATKAVNLPPSQLVNLHVALKGTRRVRSWGCFYLNRFNPLRKLRAERHKVCQCPDCNSKLVVKPERDFAVEGHWWLNGLALTVRTQVQQLNMVRRSLSLTGQLSSPIRPPP